MTDFINGFSLFCEKKGMCSFMYRFLIIHVNVNLVQFASYFEILFQMNERFEASTDAKSQLKFLEELDKLEKKRHDDQEWEKIMKAAKVRLEILVSGIDENTKTCWSLKSMLFT